MGLCSGKLGLGTNQGDVLATTAWVREVVTQHQKKRKGVSKFCNFTFEPLGRSCNDLEEHHKISVGFLNSKNLPQTINWIFVFAASTLQSPSPISAEIKIRTTFVPDLQQYLSNSSYKRAKYLVNIPELIYHEQKQFGQILKQYLVLEDIQATKKCNPSPPYLVQAGMDLTHLNLVLSTLAQFHAVSLAWKQSLEDDSILDTYPFLSRPPCPNMTSSKKNKLLVSYRKILNKIHDNSLPEKLEEKLEYLQKLCDGLSEPNEEDLSNVTGTVGLGCISPQHVAFQITDEQACAAISRVPNMCFTTITRDLAIWVFTLANKSVRRHYILEILHNYATTLTNALDLLGVNYHKFGITFHQLCHQFYTEAGVGVLVSILVAMNDTSEDDIDTYLRGEMVTEKIDDTEKSNIIISIPLSSHRLSYLEHLLDDIYCFLDQEKRKREYEVLC